METFKSVLDKINYKILELEQNSKDLVEDSKSIQDFFYFLATTYNSDFQDLLNSFNIPFTLNKIEIKVYQHLKDNNFKYSLVSDLNQLFIKEAGIVRLQVPVLSGTEILNVFSIPKEYEYSNIFKYYLSQNHQLEVVSLAHGLKLL